MLENVPAHIHNPNPSIYASNNYLVVDFETTNIDVGDPRNNHNDIRVASWKYKNKLKTVKGSEFDLADLVADIEEADFIVAHNAKFELGWLVRCGLDIKNVIVWCSMVAEHVLCGNRQWRVGLDACLKRRGWQAKDFVGILIRSGVDTDDIPLYMLANYCEKDVELTERLFLDQRKHIEIRDLTNLLYSRCLLTPVLSDIENNGMKLDAERVENLYFTYALRLSELESEFEELTDGINFKSPKQVQEYLYDTLKFKELKDPRGKPLRTASGGRRTDSTTLVHLKATTPEQKKFIELKKELNKLQAALSKTIRKFHECVTDTTDNILFASFNQCGTQTHRLSSSGSTYRAQFQNIDRQFKPLFKSRMGDGWSIGEFDFSQLEFRVAAFLGQDTQAMGDIARNEDVHAYTASIIFKEEWALHKDNAKSARRDEIRTASKAHTFKPLFGGQSGTDAEMEYYEAFRRKYTGITRTQDEWKNTVVATKFLRIPSGLVFYWPNAKFDKSGYFNYTTNVCNYPVQSFATADIVPIAITYMWHIMKAKGLKSFIINTVHDSIIAEVPDEEQEIMTEIMDYVFGEVVKQYLSKIYAIDFNVPLLGDTKYGSHWSQPQGWEEKYLQGVVANG